MAWASIEPGSDPQVIAIGCSKAEYQLAKQIPGAQFGKPDSLWRVPLTWATYMCMRYVWQTQPLEVYPELRDWAAAKRAEVSDRYTMRSALDASPAMVTTLLALERHDGPHLDPIQRASAEWMFAWRRVILNDDRGSGKTPPTIQAMQLMHQLGQLAPALVVCPDSAPLEWQRKLATWAPGLRTVIIAGSAKQRAAAIEALGKDEYDVGIIIWQNLRYHTKLAPYPGQAMVLCDACGGQDGKRPALCEKHPKDFNEVLWATGTHGVRTVIADECHAMAEPGVEQTRAAWWLMHHAENVLALTGTVTVNDVGNLWAIEHGLDPAGFGVRTKWNGLVAEAEYAFAGRGQTITGIKPEAAELFRWCIEPTFRRTPKAIARAGDPVLAEAEFLYPPMTPAQARAYKAITKAGLAELGDMGDMLVPDNTVVKFTRQCQLASFSLRLQEGEDRDGFETQDVVPALPSNKIDALIKFLALNRADPEAGTSGQWVVAVNSPALVALAEAKLRELKITCTHITGGMDYRAKDAAQQAFQAGEYRVIFVNAAGSTAIDLYAADGVIWLQPDPSFVYREQMMGRVDRRGQTKRPRSVWVLSPGTVDIRIFELGLGKEFQHQEVVRDRQWLQWIMNVRPDEIWTGDTGNDTTISAARA